MKHFSSPLWRTIAGFLFGVTVNLVGMELFFFTKWDASPVLYWITLVLAAPVVGIIHALGLFYQDWALFEAAVPFIAWLPFPIVFALLFRLVGETQTRKVVLIELFIIVSMCAFGVIGFPARN